MELSLLSFYFMVLSYLVFSSRRCQSHLARMLKSTVVDFNVKKIPNSKRSTFCRSVLDIRSSSTVG